MSGAGPYPSLIEGWEVTPSEAHDAVRRRGSEVILLDCRTPQEWATGRIAGAVHVPMQDLAARLPELEQYADTPLIVYCHHGRRSFSVTEFLRKQGFSSVMSMAGGIDRWSIEVDPSVPRY